MKIKLLDTQNSNKKENNSKNIIQIELTNDELDIFMKSGLKGLLGINNVNYTYTLPNWYWTNTPPDKDKTRWEVTCLNKKANESPCNLNSKIYPQTTHTGTTESAVN